jgi:hypothetical protein
MEMKIENNNNIALLMAGWAGQSLFLEMAKKVKLKLIYQKRARLIFPFQVRSDCIFISLRPSNT